jgi:nucleoside-diphosphate-sugar epimerase
MKVLITGGAGFLGSHLTDAHLAKGDEVYVLDVAQDHKIRHHLGNPCLHYVRESIFRAEILEELIRAADLVYHLAAVVGVEHYVADPYQVMHVNINGTEAVLTRALKHRKKVVFSSTSEVYGRSAQVPFEEDGERVLGSTHIDRWCYATAKSAAEHLCFAFHKRGLPVVVLRYFNVYGPRMDQLDMGRVIPIFMGQLLRGEALTIIGDGLQTRCFTYVDDAIRATVVAGLKAAAVGEIVNIGTDEEVSIKELAEAMIRISGSRSMLKFVTPMDVYGPGYEDIRRRVPSITKMRALLGGTPQVPLEVGLQKTIAWFRQSAPEEVGISSAPIGAAWGEGE